MLRLRGVKSWLEASRISFPLSCWDSRTNVNTNFLQHIDNKMQHFNFDGINSASIFYVL